RAKLSATTQRLEEAGRRTGELRTEREAALAELHDVQWQLSAADETIRTRAMHAEGVRRFLEKPAAGVLGAVTDFAIVEPGDELAVEKALGRFLQGVALESREVAERVAKSLSDGQKAEIHFVFPGSD